MFYQDVTHVIFGRLTRPQVAGVRFRYWFLQVGVLGSVFVRGGFDLFGLLICVSCLGGLVLQGEGGRPGRVRCGAQGVLLD